MEWNVVTILGAHGWSGAPDPRRSQPTCWGQPKKSLRTVWRATAVHRHESLIIAHVFKSCLFKHSKELKHSNTRRGKAELSTRAPCLENTRLRYSNTEPSSPSLLHLNKQITIPVYTCKQKNTQMCIKVLEHPICLFLLLYRQIHTKLCQNICLWRVSSILFLVMSYVKVIAGKNSDVHHYTGCIVS